MRALKLQFQLDDEALEVLRDELIEAQHLAADEAGKVLVWMGDAGSYPAPAQEPVRAPHAYTPMHLAEKILTSRSALYEIDGPHVLVSPEWAQAVELGRWPSQVRPYTRNRRHTLYQVC